MQTAEIEYAICVNVHGLKRIEGRVLLLPDLARVFYRPRPHEHLGAGGFSLDERVAYLLMQTPDVSAIHLSDAEDNLWMAGKEKFWAKAVPLVSVAERIHLPRAEWVRAEVWYEANFKRGEREKFAVEWPPESRTAAARKE